MISRRAALASAAAVGTVGAAGFVAQRVGVLDDGLRAAGMRPRAEPDPRDVALLADAAAGQAALIAALDALRQGEPTNDLARIRAVLAEQLAAVSDDPAARSPAPAPRGEAGISEVAERVEATAAARADGALSAGSLAVAKVLAAMSAGLEQVAVAVRRLA